MGSIMWMFDRLGVAEATHTDKSLDIEGVAIEAGAQNVEPLEGADVPAGQIGARFICDPSDLDTMSRFLTKSGWTVTSSELSYIAKNFSDLSKEQSQEVAEFLNAIDEHDDVHRVYAAIR